MTPTIPVLDHGCVELIDSMGDDLAIVQAAQASFDNASESYGDREAGILRFLMREEHGVPFEHVVLKYRLKLPIFLARQLVKHRMSSWSEQSGRYDELAEEFYVPDRDQVRTQLGRPGSYTFAEVPWEVAEAFRLEVMNHNRTSFQRYRMALDSGIAKEQARIFLPTNLYTTVVWTLNMRSLFNVLHLRADSHAQREAQVYAIAMERLAATVVPDTIRMFVDAGRPKP